jgi:hypothetical protein
MHRTLDQRNDSFASRHPAVALISALFVTYISALRQPNGSHHYDFHLLGSDASSRASYIGQSIYLSRHRYIERLSLTTRTDTLGVCLDLIGSERELYQEGVDTGAVLSLCCLLPRIDSPYAVVLLYFVFL